MSHIFKPTGPGGRWTGALPPPISISLLVAFVASLLHPVVALAQTDRSSYCQAGNAARAANRLDCMSEQQLETILAFNYSLDDENQLRTALGIAAEISPCVNDLEVFPEVYQRRQDFLCLQRTVLDFYGRLETGLLHSEDRLARALFSAYHCIFPTEIPDSDAVENPRDCAELVARAMVDYRAVFRAANQIKSYPERYSSAYLAEQLGMDPLNPGPDYSELEKFIEVAAAASNRYPELGRQIGTALGPTLCDAWVLYEDQRPDIGAEYNLLIRMDGGNVAGTSQLYRFLRKLNGVFQLEDTQWASTAAPCTVDESELEFPEFRMRPGYPLSPRARLETDLVDLAEILEEAARRFESPLNLWKPFQRYGDLLHSLAKSLKLRSTRRAEARMTRKLILEKSRDAFLSGLRFSRLEPSDPALSLIQSSVTSQIRDVSEEYFREVMFDEMKEFAEPYLDEGEGLLAEFQMQLLNRYLAIAYFLQDDRSKALKHVRDSDITVQELRQMRQELSRLGIGVRIRR